MLSTQVIIFMVLAVIFIGLHSHKSDGLGKQLTLSKNQIPTQPMSNTPLHHRTLLTHNSPQIDNKKIKATDFGFEFESIFRIKTLLDPFWTWQTKPKLQDMGKGGFDSGSDPKSNLKLTALKKIELYSLTQWKVFQMILQHQQQYK